MNKLTRSARGMPCQIRFNGCNGGPNNETVVYAHLNGGGMGSKVLDIHGAYSCAHCHDILDGRVPNEKDRDFVRKVHLEGVIKTQEILVAKGLI